MSRRPCVHGHDRAELGIACNTVKGYIKNVHSKCEIHSRQDAIDLVDMRIEHLR